MLAYKTHVTVKNGAEATIEGHPDAIEAIEAALMSARFRYNNKLETWGNGFYGESKYELTPGGSVECPHCRWGFAPSVIEQHIREKH